MSREYMAAGLGNARRLRGACHNAEGVWPCVGGTLEVFHLLSEQTLSKSLPSQKHSCSDTDSAQVSPCFQPSAAMPQAG